MKHTSFFKHYQHGLLLLALVGLTLTDSTPSLAVGSEPPRSRLEDFASAPQPATTDGLGRPTALDRAAFVSWNRIAFQSYRDYNWEIYTSNNDGSGLARVTNNSSVDIHPRLNRGATRLVFASYRTGNYDLFTVNPEGSGLTQITATPTDDVYPAWSPDGTRLAFQAYRDGQAEIYVMNADGSGVMRLTFNTDNTNGNAYDAQPSWSPDGTRIAFISKRTGGYRVWVMNADGSGQTQLSNQPYSADPVWSPDGSRIAYDADNDNSGWQELWVMNSDGSNPDEISPGAGSQDYLAGSWSPEGHNISYTHIYYIEYGGVWYWTDAYLQAYDFTAGIHWYLGANSTLDWSPDWQTLDTLRPQSQVVPLAQFARVTNTIVSWSGTDSGGSGLAAYDVQYRVGEAGAWVDWMVGTPGTAAGFAGTPGTTVYFRSRARDQAFNQEAWPVTSEGDTHTTFYTWQLDGTIEDVRNQPLAGASVTGVPAPAAPITTDPNGNFDAYMTVSGTQTLTVTKTGYESLLGEVFDLITDTQVSYWLPPTDNQLTNGGFETGDLTGWQAGGALTPTLRSEAAHSGAWGVRLGQPAPYAPPQWKGNSEYSANNAVVAYDSSGQLIIVWADRLLQTGLWQVKYTTCSPTMICQTPLVIGPGLSPHLEAGPDGVVHLIWYDYDAHILYMQWSSAGGWNTPQILASSASGPTLAVDPNGTPHVAWIDNNTYGVYYQHRNLDGTWTAPELVSNVFLGILDMAVEANGTVHLVSSPVFAYQPVFYSRRTPESGWGPIEQITGNDASSASIVADSQGMAHIVWQQWQGSPLYTSGINYRARSADGSWSNITTLQSPASTAPRLIITQPNDTLMMVWTAGSELKYTYQHPDGTWSAPRLAYGPGWGNFWSGTMALDIQNQRLAVAGDRSVTYERSEVYATQFDFLPEQAGPAWLQQEVVVPASLHQPTLGVTYVYSTEGTGADDWLTLAIVDASTTTPITSIVTSTAGWQHTWLDLSPWQGQTITVLVEISTTANDLYSWAFIDEMTVGSWLTPIIETISPVQVEDPATLPMTLTLTGQNFIATPTVLIGPTLAQNVLWVDETTLLAEVPAGLLPGIYAIRVINPEGQEAVKPSAFILGKTTFFPIISR